MEKLSRLRMEKHYEQIIGYDSPIENYSLNYHICVLMESIMVYEQDEVPEEFVDWFKEIRVYLILKFPDMYDNAMSYIERIGVG